MMPSTSKNENQEDWEIVSGLKSLTTETVKSVLESIEGETLSFKEESALEEKEQDDWYTTIPPATPANTPEYTPTPPAYPSAGIRKDLTNLESGELFPIKEVKEDAIEETKANVTEDQAQHKTETGEGTPKYFEYTPADSDNEGAEPTNKPFAVIESWLYRLATYLIVFSIVKWVASKVWSKFKSETSVNETK